MSLRIAVILPHIYRGGTLRGALNIARMLSIGVRQNGDVAHLSFGHVDAPETYSASDFSALRELGIAVRPFISEHLKDSRLAPFYDLVSPVASEKRSDLYLIFNDRISNFEDADFWLIISDRLALPIPPHRRYAVVIYDYIQRYVPEILGTGPEDAPNWKYAEQFLETARRSSFVICTSEQTRQDCISYAGVPSNRVKLFPMEFDPVYEGASGASRPSVRITWTTNSSPHKNHLNIIEGLEAFLKTNANVAIEVCVTGFNTQLFSPEARGQPLFDDPYITRIREKLAGSPLVASQSQFLGDLPDSQYFEILSASALLLHGSLYDNGTFSVLEAAWASVPSVSSDYPAMREISARFHLPLTYFDATSPESLSAALDWSLAHREELQATLPTREVLGSFTYKKVAGEYWRRFKQAVEEV